MRPRSSAETPLARKPGSTPVLREPLDRLLRRPGLAALDLADVFLREAVAGEVCLRQSGVDAQRAQALTETSVGKSSEAGCLRSGRSSQVGSLWAALRDNLTILSLHTP